MMNIFHWHNFTIMCALILECLYTHLHTDAGVGNTFSILDVMKTAQLASRALSRNLSMTLPPDYTSLTLAEVFYMATMGGAIGIWFLVCVAYRYSYVNISKGRCSHHSEGEEKIKPFTDTEMPFFLQVLCVASMICKKKMLYRTVGSLYTLCMCMFVVFMLM